MIWEPPGFSPKLIMEYVTVQIVVVILGYWKTKDNIFLINRVYMNPVCFNSFLEIKQRHC